MDLAPYVPRLVLEWAASEPERRHRTIEGTGVFADLSGFTALSERLARIGREGAEELTDVIDATFTALLDPAYEAGGSLLKFGGDALFLFFDGAAHELRGCWTAHTMRRVLRDVGKVQTQSGARTTLRMTTGVHSGAFEFFLVGQGLRELLVVGATTTRLLEMEDSADTGRIVVSPELSQRLPARLIGDEHGAGRLLARAPATPTSQLDDVIAAVPTTVEPDPFIEQSLVQHLGGGTDEPEHRRAAIAFVRVIGLDAMLREDEAEAVADTLEHLINAVVDVSDRHHVTLIASDVYPDGIKLLLTAGVPTASEFDEEHLLRAVVDDAFAEFRGALQVGVHRGHLFAGSIGPPYRRTYTVMGDAVNTSARIMQQARPGEVLTTDDVIGRTRVVFDILGSRTFRAKGKQHEIEAQVLGRPTTDRRDAVAAELPLVGREAEVMRLRSAIDAVRTGGRGSVIEIVGPAGVGKSRLVAEVARHGSDLRVLEIASDEYAETTPYFAAAQLLRLAAGCSPHDPIRSVLRGLRAKTERLSPQTSRWIPLLSLVMGPDEPDGSVDVRFDEDTRRARLAPTYIETVAGALDTPTLIVAEDSHWMDAASRDLLKAVFARAQTHPWAVVISRRPEGAPVLEPSSRIEVGPLSEAEAAELAVYVAGRPLLHTEAARLVAAAEGNPLFVRELLAHGRGEEIPDSIGGLMAHRIDALPSEDRSVLRYLSVLGNRAPGHLVHGLLRELGGDLLHPVWARLNAFVSWSDDEELRFRHALVRSAAYEGLPFRRRRDLHRVVLRLLESDNSSDDQARSLHAHLATDYERSFVYSRAAAEEAFARFAYLDAVALFRRCVDAGRRSGASPTDLSWTFEQLGYALFLSGRVDHVESAYAAARKLSSGSSPETRARLFKKTGELRRRLRKTAAARRWFVRGLRELENEPKDEEALIQITRLRVGLAMALQDDGRLDESLTVCEQALRSAASSDLAGRVLIRNQMLRIAHRLRDPAARKYGEEALQLAREIGSATYEANILNNLAVDAKKGGDWKRAVEMYAMARDLLEDLGRPVHSAAAAHNAAIVLLDQGSIDSALEALQRSKTIFDTAGIVAFAREAAGNIGVALTRSGRLSEGREILQEVYDSYTAKASHERTSAAIALALNAVMRCDPSEADRVIGAERDGAAPDQRPQLLRLAGYSRLQQGDTESAKASFEESLGLADAVASRFDVALAHEALERLARITGGDPGPHERGKQAIFDELSVIRTPEIPLPERVP